jgi:aminoglycoside 3-N-acetyltransferase I
MRLPLCCSQARIAAPPSTLPIMIEIRTKRLTVADRELARALFAMMAEVFGEAGESLSDAYLDRLLGRVDFWAIAAVVDDEIVGGLTAHALALTRAERSEMFIYDIAVRKDRQRMGVGRHLMTSLFEAADAVGIHDVFVPADNEDLHALDFYRALGGVADSVTFFTFSSAG